VQFVTINVKNIRKHELISTFGKSHLMLSSVQLLYSARLNLAVVLASVNEEVVFSDRSIRLTYIFGEFWCGFEPNIWLIK
jgi:hypothetical protein